MSINATNSYKKYFSKDKTLSKWSAIIAAE